MSRWTTRNAAYKKRNAEKKKQWHVRNHEKVRRHRWKEQGIDPDQAELLLKQATKCEGCGSVPPHTRTLRLVPDHDHTTGLLRGVLCGRCNRVLGLLQDSPTILRALAQYLEQRKSK